MDNEHVNVCDRLNKLKKRYFYLYLKPSGGSPGLKSGGVVGRVDLSPPSVCAYGAIAGCACAGQGRRRSLFLFPLVSVWVTPPRVTCARRCRPAGLALRATVVWRAIVGWRPWSAAASGGRRRTGYARGPRRQTGAGPARGWGRGAAGIAVQ
jgi:hypothetical protein